MGEGLRGRVRLKTYKVQTINSARIGQLCLLPEFHPDHWDDVSPIIDEKIGHGFLTWDIDLRKLTLINSIMLGYFVELNGKLMSTRGSLRLILKRDSKLLQLIALSKIHLIIPIHEC